MSAIADFLNTQKTFLREKAESQGFKYGFDFLAGEPKQSENFVWKELASSQKKSDATRRPVQQKDEDVDISNES